MQVQLTGAIRSDRDLVAWIAGGGLRDARALTAWNGGITDAGARALAEAADAGALETLDLSWNAIGPDGAGAIARSPVLRGLTQLRLYHNDLGCRGAEHVAATAHRLEMLNVCGNQLGDAGAAALAAGGLSALRDLALGWNGFGRAAADRIATGPWRTLARLNVRANRLDGAAAAALLAGALPELVWLGLDENPIGNDGLLAMIDAPGFDRLEWLNLGGTELDDRVVAPAVARLRPGALRELRLHDNDLSPGAIAALSEVLPGCEVLA